MWVELGHFCLILALGVSLIQAVLPLLGTFKPHSKFALWQALARPAAVLVFVLVSLSFATLAGAFLGNDFSVRYVSEHSNSMLPAHYQFAAVWGGHEGSLLLWVEILSLWGLSVAVFSKQLPLSMVARVLSVLGWVAIGFLLFILTTSNPFERLVPALQEGKDLNPLLQDPALVIHPPMLYMGYVGFSVAFAFAIAALLSGRLDVAWARWSRPWTLVAWVFMSFGIGLGSWWAYNVLGWGGWWFWDPVENASLLPWLCGTALLHSLMMTEKRGGFKAWTVLLAIAAFSLSLLGTFLVRSGVLNSVHAFASDPKRGVFILVFLALVVGTSLTLFAWRAPKLKAAPGAPVLRETLLLLNSVFLVVACAAVLLGTVYPMVIDALNLGKLSVGAPYFNLVFVPLMVPILVLLVPGVVSTWKDTDGFNVLRRLWPMALLSLTVGLLVPAWMGHALAVSLWSPGVTMGVALATWVAAGTLQHLLPRWLAPGRVSMGFVGMHLAHLGLAVLVLGVTLVKGYEVERDVSMNLGDTLNLQTYRFVLDGVQEVPGPNYAAKRADVSVFQGEQKLTVLHPEKRRYFSSPMPMTQAAIDVSPWRDLYVSLGEPMNKEQTQWSLRVYNKPFVSWIWAGVLLMMAGGIVAAADRRYRKSPKV